MALLLAASFCCEAVLVDAAGAVVDCAEAVKVASVKLLTRQSNSQITERSERTHG